MNPESGLSSRSYTFAIHSSVALFSLDKFLPKLLKLYPNLKAGYGVLPSRVARKFSTFKKLRNAPIFKDEICLVYRVEKNKDKIEKEIIKAIKEAKI